MRALRTRPVLLLLAAAFPFLVVPPVAARGSTEEPTLRIAEQYGIAYAPVTAMRTERILAEALPGHDVEWIQLSNAAAIREAMLAGRLDIGFMGIPPFLLGEARGMEWRIFTGLAQTPLGLVTTDPEIVALADLVGKTRIALPQPGSIQHILLAMAAERDLGDASLFDTQLVSMAHPDALQAIVAGGEIRAHFTSEPFLSRELQLPGARLVLSGRDAFGGPFSFIVGVVSSGLATGDPDTVAAVADAIVQAMARIERDAAVRARVAAAYGLDAQEFDRMLAQPGLTYERNVRGVEEFRAFMVRTGYIPGTER